MGGAKTIFMSHCSSLDCANKPVSTQDDGACAKRPVCYSIAVFTQRWRDIRDFYTELLGARVLSEKADVYCEMTLGGVPICLRTCEHGESPSYFHIYLALRDRDGVLAELRRRGIVVTTVGPYTNFRDPEGRVIKLSEEATTVG
jgi:catechol 2,3-dioxygenase-like lactoylglutathione lyase family enzyme